MGYNFLEIEKKWQDYWKNNQVYHTLEKKDQEKYYVLDMFPYPSRTEASIDIKIQKENGYLKRI